MKEKKAESMLRFAMLMSIAAVVIPWAACAVTAASAGLSAWSAVFVYAVWLAIGFLLTIPAHETGHLLFGLAAGFHFELYEILGIQLRRTARGVRWMLEPLQKGRVMLALGRVQLVPGRMTGRGGLCAMFLGGLAVNALLGIGMTVGAFCVPPGDLRSGLAAVGAINLFFLINNSVDGRSLGAYTDMDVVRLLRGPEGERFLRVCRCEGALFEGALPSEAGFPTEILESGEMLLRYQTAVLTFVAGMEEENEEKIRRAVEFVERVEAEKSFVNIERVTHRTMRFVYEAAVRGNEEAARAVLAETPELREGVNAWSVLGMAALENTEEARERALRCLEDAANRGEARIAERWLRRIA